MAISATSRYANATVTVVEDDRGKHQSMNLTPPGARAFDFTYYQWRDYDTIDYLAHMILGDGRLWWVIADANPEILDWTTVPTGTILRSPDA